MFCPICGMDNQDGASFCMACGSSLTDAGQKQPAAPNFRQAQEPNPNTPLHYQPDDTQPPTYQQPAYRPDSGYSPLPPYNPAPYYGARPLDPSKNWAAITSLITGILSIVVCVFNPSYIWVTLVLAICGIVFGIIGLKSSKKGLAIAGICCSAVGVWFFLFSLYGYLTSYRGPDI